jgi:hypothetical protein
MSMKEFQRILIWKVTSPPSNCLIIEPIQDKTRFSMMTGDHPESSIHDLMQDSENVTSYRDREITELKSQLDNILEHVNPCHFLTNSVAQIIRSRSFRSRNRHPRPNLCSRRKHPPLPPTTKRHNPRRNKRHRRRPLLQHRTLRRSRRPRSPSPPRQILQRSRKIRLLPTRPSHNRGHPSPRPCKTDNDVPAGDRSCSYAWDGESC